MTSFAGIVVDLEMEKLLPGLEAILSYFPKRSLPL
jgi:hypothetical protein